MRAVIWYDVAMMKNIENTVEIEFAPNYRYVINGERVAYMPEEDQEDDCTKRWHKFRNEAGKVVVCVDFSPYDDLTVNVIENWIARGCPSPKSLGLFGPLDAANFA